jgi:hypothetical protein
MYMSNIIIQCPHCNMWVIIEQLNCGIFRHGQYISNWNFVEPHMPKAQCERLLQENKVFGCMKPFRIIKTKDDEWNAEICDYI